MDRGSALAPSGRPRGLFVIHDLRPGGAERTFIRYVNELEVVEARPVLVRPAITWADRLRSGMPLIDLEHPVPRTGPPGDSRDLSPEELFPRSPPWYEPFAVARAIRLVWKGWRLARLVDRTGAELVATFLMESHVIGIVARLLFRRQFDLVVNVHAQMSDHIRRHHPWRVQLVLRAFVRYLLPRAEMIVAVSEGVKQDLTENFGIGAHRIVVVPNPLDVRAIRASGAKAAAWPLPDAPGHRIMSAGRLVPLKGYDHLIRAFDALPEEVDASLVILGEGEDRGRLEALVAELGLGERVALPGYRDDPWSLMAGADLFVLSSHTEASPNVLGEALALGLPVVATECSPGVREYLEPGPCGLLAAPGDVADLARKMTRVLTDPELRGRLRSNARDRAQALEGADGVRKYEHLLRVVMGYEDRSVSALPGTARPMGSTDP